ncbi:putative transposase, orfB [Calothrix sp. NIES-4101]|nr:putative transposase, orfB [Calothrix sp. NIES-4101]
MASVFNSSWTGYLCNAGDDYAILQIDQAPAHTSSKLCWPENIIPLFQPASAPELNPIERLWQLLKKPLKNQLFSSLQALRDRIQEIFDQLTLEQVISISSYNFILEALFYAAYFDQSCTNLLRVREFCFLQNWMLTS